MKLVSSPVRVIKPQPRVQVMQLPVAAQQEAAHARVGGGPRLLNAQVMACKGAAKGRLRKGIAALSALHSSTTSRATA